MSKQELFPSINEVIFVNGQKRKVVEYIKNEKNEFVLAWQSKREKGVIIPSVWTDWQNGERLY